MARARLYRDGATYVGAMVGQEEGCQNGDRKKRGQEREREVEEGEMVEENDG